MVYLTRAEHALFLRLPRGAFGVSDVLGRTNRRYVLALVDRLVRKKELVRLAPGRFFRGSNTEKDRLRMALASSPGGYLGLLSALQHYGLVDEQLSRVFVCTRSRRGLVDLGSFDVMRVALGDDFFGIVPSGDLRVSSRPKTFFDCLKKTRFCGGIKRILSALDRAALSRAEWRELLYYVTQSASKSFRQRCGFWLSPQAPAWFLKELEKSIGRKSIVRIGGLDGKEFNRRWRVYHGLLS